ncbi:MAG: M56 family metallopeptidase [Roseburia sp.]|nr:M56 family metallopeptidase [Roseburia sp.]
MNLASQIFFAMIITSFTGSIAYAIWRLFLKACYNHDPVLKHCALRMACMLYILPIGYLLVQTLRQSGFIICDDVWQAHFEPNRVLMALLVLPAFLWAVMVGRNIRQLVRENTGCLETVRCSVLEEDPAVEKEFLRIKEKMHIRRKIGLYRNCDLVSPIIAGIFRVRIVLPAREYTKEQLTVIFSHELTHYRSCDVFFRVCGTCVKLIQCLGPFAANMDKYLCEWSECECDRKTTNAMRDEFTVGEYFTRILDMSGPGLETFDGNEAFAMLFETRLGLERRIEYMKVFGNWKPVRRFTSVMLAVAFVVLSISTTYAAGVGLATVHDFLYLQTQEYGGTMTEVPNEFQLGEVHFLPAEEAHTYDECIDADLGIERVCPTLDENKVISFNWSMQPYFRTRSVEYSFDTLDKISITCQGAPANQTYWVGIEDSKGNVWYTEAQGSAGFLLRIPADGKYRVIVENRGSSNITVAGSYYYYILRKA